MSDDGQNFSVFNSRILVDTVGDVTDEALKASRMKEVIGVLAGRLFNWGQRKSLFPLHLGIKCCALEMAAAGASRFDAERFGVFFRPSPPPCDVLLVHGPEVTSLELADLLNVVEISCHGRSRLTIDPTVALDRLREKRRVKFGKIRRERYEQREARRRASV